MKKLMILLLAVIFIAAGCTPQADNKMSDGAETIKAEGELEQGQRVIRLEPGFEGKDITVYRGNTVRFVFSGEGHVSISLPEFEAEAEGDGSVDVTVKVKEVGEYAITACVGETCESGMFKVVEYQEEGRYYKVAPDAFEAQMTGNYVLLDVRTQQEYDAGAIDGATLIPLSELSSRVGEIAQYDKVLVYCRSGNRSVAASEILLDAGFADVYDLQGGISAWEAYKSE